MLTSSNSVSASLISSELDCNTAKTACLLSGKTQLKTFNQAILSFTISVPGYKTNITINDMNSPNVLDKKKKTVQDYKQR